MDQGHHIPPKDRPSLAELKGGQPEGRVQHCPACGRRLFYVMQTWTNKDGTIRRQRKCSMCGHVVNSSETFDE